MRSTSVRIGRYVVLAGLGVVAYAPVATPQSFGVEVAFDQSFTSFDEWDTPSGVGFAVGAGDVWQGFGFRLDYRTVSEPGGEVSMVCSFAGCTVGPFSQRYQLGAVGLGITKSIDLPAAFELVLALNASVFRQSRRLERLSNGERQSNDSVSDYGLGPSLALRLPRTLLGIRPLGYVRYDRIFAGGCDLDASCYGDRNVRSVGIGLSWGM